MSSAQPQQAPDLIDPRGPRFGAAITSVLLALAIVLGPAIGGWVLLLQTLALPLAPCWGSATSPGAGSTARPSGRGWQRRRSWRIPGRRASRRPSGSCSVWPGSSDGP
jgi:hypothetical protein